MILGRRLLQFRGAQKVFAAQFTGPFPVHVIKLDQTITASVQVAGSLHRCGHLTNLTEGQIIEGKSKTGDGMGSVDLVIIQLGTHHEGENGIPCLLSGHTTQDGPRERIFSCIPHGRGYAGGGLVGLGVVNDPLELAKVKVDEHHDPAQVLQELRI